MTIIRFLPLLTLVGQLHANNVEINTDAALYYSHFYANNGIWPCFFSGGIISYSHVEIYARFRGEGRPFILIERKKNIVWP